MRVQIANAAVRVMAGGALAVACLGGLPGAAEAAAGAGAAAGPARFVRCGAGALAEAIAAGGRLMLSRGCVYLLRAPLPVIRGALYIEGNKATIRRNRAVGTPGFSLLQVGRHGTLTIRDAILRNGRSPGHGGAIDNAGGQLIVINVVFKHNTARQGGAIWNGGGGVPRPAPVPRKPPAAGGPPLSAGRVRPGGGVLPGQPPAG